MWPHGPHGPHGPHKPIFLVRGPHFFQKLVILGYLFILKLIKGRTDHSGRLYATSGQDPLFRLLRTFWMTSKPNILLRLFLALVSQHNLTFQSLEEYKLEMTQIVHFVSSPSAFFYLSILTLEKIVEEESVALHKKISELFVVVLNEQNLNWKLFFLFWFWLLLSLLSLLLLLLLM